MTSITVQGEPKLSVVIPTRERADTLKHTLRTVVTQDYPKLEIIVSDNCSCDDTRDVVRGFDDPRITYSRTDTRLGMSSNWEHGLSLVTGDYVMFLGDDDGLMPGACSDVARLTNSLRTEALIWLKPDYLWPGVGGHESHLNVFIGNSLIEIDSKLLLRALGLGLTSYGRLPVAYSGFVSTGVINTIKAKCGRFFCSVTPDVYSGIVIAGQVETYHYSTRPFSVNGGSKHSNGLATSNDRATSDLFFAEADISTHPQLSAIRGSIASCVAEAFLQAQERDLTRNIRLSTNRYYTIVYRELAAHRGPLAAEGMRQLATYELPRRIRKLVDSFDVECPSARRTGEANTDSSGAPNRLFVPAASFGVSNVYDACALLNKLLGNYSMPSIVQRAAVKEFALTGIYRAISGISMRYLLPF